MFKFETSGVCFFNNASHVISLKALERINLGNMSTSSTNCCPKWQLEQANTVLWR